MEFVKVLDGNREALLWRLRLICAAKKKIVMFVYKMRSDESGKDMIAALADAAKRGVEEYIVVDSLSSRMFLKSGDELDVLVSLPNVHFFFYNPVKPGRIRKFSCRLHDKILAIDDEYYMTGGRNVVDVSIGDYVDTFNIDRDVVVASGTEGVRTPSIVKANEYIEELLKEKCLLEYNGKKENKKNPAAALKLEDRFKSLSEKNVFIKNGMADLSGDGFITADEVRMFYSSPKAKRKKPGMWDEFIKLMLQGEDVLVQTPYIMCDKKMYDDLEKVAATVPHFAIITNAPESGANIFGCVDYLNQKEKIRKKGIKVYECNEEQSLHTKAILIDDDISIIGSFNFDMRSVYIDTETMLLIRSKEINRSLRKTAAAHMEKSRTVDGKGDIVYGDEYNEKKLSTFKAVLFAILRILIHPFRRLL